MSEIEPPWIANENLELYHLRFHLRSRARQLGSALDELEVDVDSMSTLIFVVCFQGESVSTQSRNAHLDLQLVASLN